jgi:hypothetical protein
MRRFEDWWQDSIRILDSPCKIRNWTADKGYTVEGHFFARSYRSLSEEEQNDWNEGHPFAAPNNWIVCTQVKGGKVAVASKKEFQDRYDKWRAYKGAKINRTDFRASPYVISIFHALEKLMD